MEYIYTDKAPKPGSYSQAVKYGQFIFLSGQTADDPITQRPVYGSVAEQTEIILQNIKSILEAAGSSLDRVLKCTVFLTSMDHKEEMDRVYRGFFSERPPARITVAVKGLDAGLHVEIDAIAVTNREE